MENQVLDIKQMEKLEKLGIDTSNATIFWHKVIKNAKGIDISDKTSYFLSFESNPNEIFSNSNLEIKSIPTFTLQDILDIIKEKVLKNDLSLNLELDLINNQFQLTRESDYVLYTSDGKNLLQSAFDMLKYCKQNEM